MIERAAAGGGDGRVRTRGPRRREHRLKLKSPPLFCPPLPFNNTILVA